MALGAHIENTRQQVEDEQPVSVELPEVPVEESDEEDDRVSVKETVEVVEGPPATDVDDLHDKTSTQLRELLSKKGIPFGKRDSKSVLIQLLKATA